MKNKRSSGILLHPTSLPSPDGIGDLGRAAYRFIDLLEHAGQKYWQVLPLGPTGYGDSPYQCFSLFAANPLLIDLDDLRERGLLEKADLASRPPFPGDTVDYGWVIYHKLPLLKKAFAQFKNASHSPWQKFFTAFCEEHWYWLDDYALFMA
ncbi:4-alpha-glucanotransferase, partial [bacterium]|nr:4-alpha-glucanotransferase [bacterium]